MKKVFLLAGATLCLFVSVAVNAQDSAIDERLKGTITGTKNHQMILPEAGDFALGVDATPFLNYVGNLFSDAGAEAPTFSAEDGYTIYGKYFLCSECALRLRLGLNFSTVTTKNSVLDIVNYDVDEQHYVDDVTKIGTKNINLAFGYEVRRGYGRLQGFAGGELAIAYKSSKTSYEYGIPLASNYPYTRNTERFAGGTFGIGLGLFTGVEYFIAPKISIGGEVGLGLIYTSVPKGSVTTETWLTDKNRVKTETKEQYTGEPGVTHFGTNADGRIYIMYHF